MGASADDTPPSIGWADFLAAEHQHTATGGCTHPIRLQGRIDAIDLATGELAPVYDTAAEPGGVLLTSCGNRRETVCPSCSAVYKRDARQLVRAGLSGGKGVPETDRRASVRVRHLDRPVVRAGPLPPDARQDRPALPAPPRRERPPLPARPRHLLPPTPRRGRSAARTAAVRRLLRLRRRGAVQRLRRGPVAQVHHLPAPLLRPPGRARRHPAAQQVAIRYVKVAEYQARGVVHFHAIIRLDAPGDTWQPPAPGFTAAMLADAIAQAATAAAITTGPVPGRPAVTLRFGTQTDARPVRHAPDLPGTGRALSVQAVANYIAKYATKALDAPGIPDRPIRSALDLEALRCHSHYRRMITTAWRLGGGQLTPGPTRLCKWAHMLGYGGHFLTKSRRYSTTFGILRRARTEHRRQQRHPGGERDPWGRPLDEHVVLVLHTWTYAGTGYPTAPGAELALASAAMARAHRQAATAA